MQNKYKFHAMYVRQAFKEKTIFLYAWSKSIITVFNARINIYNEVYWTGKKRATNFKSKVT